MNISNFQRVFYFFLSERLVNCHKWTKKSFCQKNANHTIFVYRKYMTDIFLTAKAFFLKIVSKIPRKFLNFFKSQNQK